LDVDFAALTTTQKNELKSTCEAQIALAASVSANSVVAALTQGSTVVTYTITVTGSMANSVADALSSSTSGLGSPAFLADLQSAVQSSVTGMGSVTLQISDVSTPATTYTEPPDFDADKASSLGGAYVTLALAIMGSAVAHIL
jgi:hypothetical protein